MCLTKGMRRFRWLLLLSVVLVQVGCSSSSDSSVGGTVDANGQPVSTVPWNKPEKWETTGQLGGLSQ